MVVINRNSKLGLLGLHVFSAAFEPPLGCMTILVVSEIESVVVNKVVSEALCSSKSEDIL